MAAGDIFRKPKGKTLKVDPKLFAAPMPFRDSPEAKRARRQPGLREYGQSTLSVLKGMTPSNVRKVGGDLADVLKVYAQNTTPKQFLGDVSSIPGAAYEGVREGGLNSVLGLLPFYSTVREGAGLRARGRVSEAEQLERAAAPFEALSFLPFGVAGAAAKRGFSAAERGARRAIGREAADLAVRDAAFATSERVPYINAEHLPGLFEDEGARALYSADPRASWTDEQGRDILYKALGAPQEPTRPATGFYRPPGKPGLVETNPATVGRLNVTLSGGEVAPAERRVMDAAEAVRAYMDAQGAGAWHAVDPRTAGGSMFIPQGGPVEAAKLDELSRLMGPVGLGDIVDTGGGVTITNFYPGPPSPETTAGMLRSSRSERLAEMMGAYPQPVSVDSGYRSMFEGVDPSTERPDYVPGSGRITKQLEDLLSEYPDAVDILDADPTVRARYASGRALDEEYGAAMGGVNPYVQTAREIAAKYGLRGLFDARRRGVPLPALAAPLAGYGLYAGDDDGSGY